MISVSNISGNVTVNKCLSDIEIIEDSCGVEYIAFRNDDYITYIIKDLETYEHYKSVYSKTIDKQKIYIIELENKIKDSDIYLEHLKKQIEIYKKTNGLLEQKYLNIEELHMLDIEKIKKIEKKLKTRNKLLFPSLGLNVLLLLIILL